MTPGGAVPQRPRAPASTDFGRPGTGSLGPTAGWLQNIRRAPRTLMVSAANGIAVLSFVVVGAVAWTASLLAGLGAIAGGWCGAHIGRILPPAAVRARTLLLAAGPTVAFFVRAYD